jgi:hypothetical protein
MQGGLLLISTDKQKHAWDINESETKPSSKMYGAFHQTET